MTSGFCLTYFSYFEFTNQKLNKTLDEFFFLKTKNLSLKLQTRLKKKIIFKNDKK